MAKSPAPTPARSSPPSADGSTPLPQTTANVNPDTASHPSDEDLDAAKAKGPETVDPLVANAPGRLDPKEAVPGTDPSIDKTLSLNTTGPFILMDPWTGKHFTDSSTAPTETPETEFVRNKLAAKLLEKA